MPNFGELPSTVCCNCPTISELKSIIHKIWFVYVYDFNAKELISNKFIKLIIPFMVNYTPVLAVKYLCALIKPILCLSDY